MTKTPYERAAAFLAEVDPRHQQRVTASIAPWIINRVAELLPPEPPLSAQASAALEPLPEWGEPIPTPGGSCPEWLTLDLVRTPGFQFQNGFGSWGSSSLGQGFEQWSWQHIPAVRFPVGHPIYAQRQLEAAGYTVTPPAPPEPDYEAYRGKLTAYLRGKHSGADADRLINRGNRMKIRLSDDDRAMIRGLIAVGVKP